MSAWAKPGVKVVCVDGKARHGALYSTLPVEGRIYTIARVEFSVWSNATGIGLHLEDLRRPPGVDGKVYPFNIDRFRPLVTKTLEQDVAKFRHLLTPSPIDAGLVPAGVELVE